MSYKVLLIDDQYQSDELQQFVLNASLEGIEIDCVGFHKEGIEILKDDKQGVYQAVILDATGYLSEREFIAQKELNNVGLTHSLMFLEGAKSDRIIPWFVYSGQEKNLGKEEFEETIKLYQVDYKFGRTDICYYVKTLYEQELLEDIKVEIDKLASTSVLLKYADLFSIIQGVPNLEKHRSTLIEILEGISKNQDYTKVRKVLESLFVSLSEVNIIPEGFTEERGWINGTSRFLSCNHNDFEFFEPEFIHPTICETLYRLLTMVQDGAHNEGALKYKVDEYSKLHTSGYLYQSVVYGLLEIICYFGNLIKTHPDKERNQLRWSRKEVVKTEPGFIDAGIQEKDLLVGKVINLNTQKGYAFFKPDNLGQNAIIPPYHVKNHSLIDEMRVRVEIEEYTDNRNNEIKYRIKRVDVL